MNDEAFVSEYLDHTSAVMRTSKLGGALAEAKAALKDVRDRNAKVLLAGNGASASMASHFAVDFTKQAGIRSLAFNDPVLITAYGNDYGYEHWVARAFEHNVSGADAALLISTSGRSANMLNAADVCRERGIKLLTFTGFETTNPLKQRGDINFWVESHAYNVVEGRSLPVVGTAL